MLKDTRVLVIYSLTLGSCSILTGQGLLLFREIDKCLNKFGFFFLSVVCCNITNQHLLFMAEPEDQMEAQ